MIFEIEEDNPVLTAEAYAIKEFSKIIKRDRGSVGDADGRKKYRAKRELAYVYFMVNYKSPYRQNYVDDHERSRQVVDAIGLDELVPDWKPDELITDALKRYEQLVKTPSLAAVQNTIEALSTTVELISVVAQQTRKLIKEAELNDWEPTLKQIGNQAIVVDPATTLVERVTAMLKLAKELQTAIDKLATTEEKVKQEFVKKKTMVGGNEKNLFEDDDAY